jgi:hypothetical protein
MCNVCGADPCANPSFCRLYRDADRRKAKGIKPQHVAEWHDWPAAEAPQNWESKSVSLDSLWRQLNDSRQHGASDSTVEAIAFSLRAGVEALRDRATLARIAQLNRAQAKKIAERLTNERWSKDGKRRVPPWALSEVETFLQVWSIADAS